MSTVLGRIFDGGPKDRDAIHVAVAPVVANEKLSPGQDVGFVDREKSLVGDVKPRIGIVDPFLARMVFPDQGFWLLLYPNTITSLRHDWTHPAFDVLLPTKDEARQWLEEFAKEAGLTFDRVVEITEDYVESGDPWVEHDSERARSAYEDTDQEKYWKCIEVLCGLEKPGDETHWYSPFSCSC